MDVKRHSKKYIAIGRAISEIRKEKRLTQEQLADGVGISKSYLSKIEAQNTEKAFSIEILFDLADFLDVDVQEFFKYVD
ncbi:MAG: helix-turn-helix domain-containing protein [Ectobacillus sp.]